MINEKLEKLIRRLPKAKPDCGGRSMKKKYWNTR